MSVMCVIGTDKGGGCGSGIVLSLPILTLLLRWVSILRMRAKNGVVYLWFFSDFLRFLNTFALF